MVIPLLLLFAVSYSAFGQTTAPDRTDTLSVTAQGRIILPPDSTLSADASPEAAFVAPAEFARDTVATDTVRFSTPGVVLTATDKRMLRAKREHKIFVPDPQRALWLSFVIPGGGQIYNRKYWKLPIFYGGFLGCMYAFTWNQQMYLDYSQAYLDIMDDDPGTNSYLTMFPPSYNIEGNISRFQTIFKNRKDRFRRWRDLSTFCFIGVYALSIIDAYVDAHLAVFDISPDLSLQWGPTSVEGPSANIGLGATLHF